MVIVKNKVASLKGKEILLYRLENRTGAYIELLNLGATLFSIFIPDKEDKLVNVILNYPKIEDYFHNEFYLGSTIGRVANRISNAGFLLNGKKYELDKNDNFNSNHGGYSGLHGKIFDSQSDDNKVTFSTTSYDGESGFPGNLKVSVTYSFSESNEVVIKYKIKADKETPVNLTNHAYFNLSAERTTIKDHSLKIESDYILEMDDEFLPTGKVLLIDDYFAFDFRETKKISDLMILKKDKMEGYNTYFISNNKINSLKDLATLISPSSGIVMTLKSTMPGFMLYTGDYLAEQHKPLSGICLEAQHYPDAPNHENFPSIYLKPDKLWEETIIYSFSKV